MFYAGWHAVADRDVHQVDHLTRRSRELLTQFPVAVMTARTDVLLGWAEAMNGDPAAGLATLRHGRARAASIGDQLHQVGAAVLEAEILLRLAQPDEALTLLDEALSTSRRSGERLWLPKAHHRRAEALQGLGRPQPEVTEEHATAVRLANQQGTRRR
jgi:predicted ATPase